MKEYMKKVMSIFLAVCLFCSFGTLSAFAAEDDPAPVVIGEFDGLLKDCWTSDVKCYNKVVTKVANKIY